MKTIFCILFSIILSSAITNQSYAQNEKVYNLKSNLIKVEADYLDVKIETWNENYISIESDITINLKESSDKHDLQIENADDGVVIKSSVDTEGIEKMVITTGKKGNKKYTTQSMWDETNNQWKFSSLNIGYEIEGAVTVFVPMNMMLEIKTLYGDVAIGGNYQQIETCSTYGMIEAKLDDVSNMSKVSFTSTYDIVDLTLDQRSDATLKLNTTYGAVFSDLPLESKSSNTKTNNNCSNISEKYVLNDGSTAINIFATYDNIYVRSSQR